MKTYMPKAGSAVFTGEDPSDGVRNNSTLSGPASRRSTDAKPHPHPHPHQDERISVTGWIRIQEGHPGSVAVRINELSKSGFQIFLDFELQFLDNYHSQLSVYRHGKTYTFNVLAHCVYIALASGKGFRHGFEFDELDTAAEDALREILG